MSVDNVGMVIKLAVTAKANTSKLCILHVTYLHTLVTRARRHSPAVKIIRHIVNKIFMICGDTTGYKHDCNYNIPALAKLVS